MLSVTRTVQRRIAGRLMNNELESISKDAMWLNQHLLEGLRTTTNRLRIVDDQEKIRIRHLQIQIYTDTATLILSVILHEKLTASQLVAKFPAVHITRSFITACTKALQSSLSVCGESRQ